MTPFFRSRRLLIAFLVLSALFAMALPALAAPGGTLTGTSLNAADCYVDITAQVVDEGFYVINMWDDGNFRAGAGAHVAAGGTLTVRFTLSGPILQGASGIGIYLEDAVGTAATTTYDADGSAQLWSDQVGTDCQNAGYTFGAVALGAGNCTNPLPTGSVVYNVPAGALAFFAPDLNSYANFNLPPGTWYISEFGESFAKVWIACEANAIYIPVENVIR
jgi:hypothetical protein